MRTHSEATSARQRYPETGAVAQTDMRLVGYSTTAKRSPGMRWPAQAHGQKGSLPLVGSHGSGKGGFQWMGQLQVGSSQAALRKGSTIEQNLPLLSPGYQAMKANAW